MLKEEDMHKIGKRSMILLLIAAMIFIPFGTSALAQSKTMDNNVSADRPFSYQALGNRCHCGGQRHFYCISPIFSSWWKHKNRMPEIGPRSCQIYI